MSDSDNDKGLGTRLVGAGRRREWTGPVVNPPVWRASTHFYEDCADLKAGHPNEDGQFHYGTRGAPTQWALADALTELEPGAFGTMLYPSGLAALSHSLLAVLKHGDVLLMTDNAYDPSRALANTVLKNMGVETRFFDPLDLDGYAELFCERTKAVLLESPGSLTIEVCDIPALAEIARTNGAVSLIDNTWASSLGFPALEHGCDISITALTKHAGGHADVLMGSASAGEKLYRKLRISAQRLGTVVSPDDTALVLRGVRTMELRLQRTTESALVIAKWLQTRTEVSRVLCPMLPGAPGHDLWKRDFSGGCGLFSFTLANADAEARARLVDSLKLFDIGYSWGGYESLAIPFDPAKNRSASAWPPAEWGTGEHLGVRLAIGLEDPKDLIADLELGFAVMENS
ncbi:cystathionine beta-lyase [Pontixanthobacter aestiaquae]|uniref:Cystathionine beta-lyase n=1 Tax=Pontixanthobacter aestiaquae TaxID=1509367 RepID=A0A844Z856_9SPHN|nr:cystathionine beta-lyase [Pontixanthobacter aestiaquae]MDN3645997.1 cystathionine beta-lyase [Pontixanthobacter aestiaquae]MXO83010.1 cystathionine beta-lyase [Pontixanthobacter aestiaquae]